MRGRIGDWEWGLCAPRPRPQIAAACGDSVSLTSSTTTSCRLLCSLPTKFRRVWADCRTKAPALAVGIY